MSLQVSAITAAGTIYKLIIKAGCLQFGVRVVAVHNCSRLLGIGHILVLGAPLSLRQGSRIVRVILVELLFQVTDEVFRVLCEHVLKRQRRDILSKVTGFNSDFSAFNLLDGRPFLAIISRLLAVRLHNDPVVLDDALLNHSLVWHQLVHRVRLGQSIRLNYTRGVTQFFDSSHSDFMHEGLDWFLGFAGFHWIRLLMKDRDVGLMLGGQAGR